MINLGISRRGVAASLLAACLFGAMPQIATAQDYPGSHTINIVVPFPPGGSGDLIGRLVQRALSSSLNATVIVTNRPGAGGNNGAISVARAKPDGLTVLVTTGQISSAPFIFKDPGYEPTKSFSGVSLIAETYSALVVPKDSPANTVQDVINEAKKRPGELSYAGAMSSSQLIAGELFKRQAGIEVTQVAYQGGSPTIQSVVKGEVSMAVASLPNVMPLANSGQLKIIAVTERKRLKEYPNIPVIAETLPDVYVPPTWVSAFVPAGTPRPIIDILSKALRSALDNAETRKVIDAAGFTPVFSDANEMDERLKSDVQAWSRIIPSVGIKPQ